MKTIIAGSRAFDDYDYLCVVCDMIDISEIVSGTARGADSLGERYAAQNNIKLTQFPADWNKHGKKAGYLRNKEMAEYGDCLVAFWDGESKGTKLMIDLARKNNLDVRVFLFNIK